MSGLMESGALVDRRSSTGRRAGRPSGRACRMANFAYSADHHAAGSGENASAAAMGRSIGGDHDDVAGTSTAATASTGCSSGGQRAGATTTSDAAVAAHGGADDGAPRPVGVSRRRKEMVAAEQGGDGWRPRSRPERS